MNFKQTVLLLGSLFLPMLIPSSAFAQSTQGIVDPPARPLSKGSALPAPQVVYSLQLLQSIAGGTIVYSETFEGTTTWTRTGSWAIGTPTSVGPSTAHGGSKCAATNLSGSYGPSAKDSLISPVITLPTLGGATETLTLDFYEYFKFESGYDYGKIYVSTNGGSSWSLLDSRTGSQLSWSQKVIDISSYAGRSVRFCFLLTSDGSTQYEGWYVDDITVTRTTPAPLSATMLSINSQQFPAIYMNIAVNVNGVGYAGLTLSNFQMFENGIRQTSNLDVVPPSAGGGQRRADIIFIMDNSGSMDPYQLAVKNNMRHFVDSLSLRGVDFALGLMRFGQGALGGDPYIEDNGILTSDTAYFKNNVWARNVVDGGTEPGYNALVQSTRGFSFRAGAQKIFILIGDEEPSQSGGVLDSALAACTRSSASAFILTVQSLYSYYKPITDATNGGLFDITASFGPILTAIANKVSNTYVVRYNSSNPTMDGKQRFVSIAVTYNTYVDTARGTYTPGQAPVITRTAATVALSASAQLNNQSLSIAAQVTDNVPPYVQSATLLYRKTGTTSYTSVAMTGGATGVWTGVIPASVVVSPGIDYYITATDGQSTASAPTENPATNPFQISILPNVPPAITHTMPSSLTPGVALVLTAGVVDNTNSVASVTLYYRKQGQLGYQTVAMALTTGTTYQGTIPASYATSTGVDYYIAATDNFGVTTYHGTADAPHQVGAGTTTPLPGEYTTDGNTVLLLHMNETSGATVSDASGYGNHGTANGTTISTGKFGSARVFNGSSDYIRVPYATSLNAVAQMTMEGWAYIHTYRDHASIVTRGTSVGVYALKQLSNKLTFEVGDQLAASQTVSGNADLPLNKWVHVAATVQGSTVNFYINGVLDKTASLTLTPVGITNTEDLTVGVDFPGATEYFDGLIDEVRISTKARLPQEFDLQLPPINLAATQSGTTINLSWQNGGGSVTLLRYKIYRGTDSTNVTLIDSTSSATYANSSGIVAGTKYFYRVSAVDITGFEGAMSYAASPGTSGTTADVWPGDCDNSGAVNVSDILPLGVYYGLSRPGANSPGNQWLVYKRVYWTSEPPGKKVYADADGSGIVDAADILPIGLNYGKTHTVTTNSIEQGIVAANPNRPQQVDGTLEISSVMRRQALSRLSIRVVLRTTQPVFGISFSVKFRGDGATQSSQQIMRFAAADTAGLVLCEALMLSRANDKEGIFEIGMTKTSGRGFSGTGQLVTLSFDLPDRTTSEISFEIVDVHANDADGNSILVAGGSYRVQLTAVQTEAQIPTEYRMVQNYPNPFNPSTTITYSVPEVSRVRLVVFDMLGRTVTTLTDGVKAPGTYNVLWNGRNDSGEAMESGVYFCRFSATSSSGKPVNQTQRMVLVK